MDPKRDCNTIEVGNSSQHVYTPFKGKYVKEDLTKQILYDRINKRWLEYNTEIPTWIFWDEFDNFMYMKDLKSTVEVAPSFVTWIYAHNTPIDGSNTTEYMVGIECMGEYEPLTCSTVSAKLIINVILEFCLSFRSYSCSKCDTI